MDKWLLSRHNTQETFGLSYPLTAYYFTEVMGRRQFGYLLESLAGGMDEFDLSIAAMLVVQGYVYVNISNVMRNIALVLPVNAKSLGAPEGLLTVERKPSLKTKLGLPWRFWRVYRETAHTYRHLVPRYKRLLDEVYWHLRACDPESLGEPDLSVLDRLFEPGTLDDATAFLNAYTLLAMVNIGLLELVSQRAPGLLNLLVGRDTSTAQLANRMWALRQLAQQAGPTVCDRLRAGETDPAAYRNLPQAAPLLEGLDRFLRTYGHRAFRHASEFEAVRLVDQPHLVLLAVGGLLDQHESPKSRAQAARQVGLETLQNMNPLRRLIWRRLLKWAGVLIELREENRNILELQNATYGLAAKLLARRHFPQQPPDYLWLYTFAELIAFGQSQGQQRVSAQEIEGRRAALEKYRQQDIPPELIWYDPSSQRWWPAQGQHEKEQASSPTDPVLLRGIAASAGTGPVEGLAVVSNNVEEAIERILKIRGPVILVTHVTDPVWSSLFSRLTAVVTEMGGAISHAATVARENGIPAVVGVKEATGQIQTGQWIRVNGATGLVEVVT